MVLVKFPMQLACDSNSTLSHSERSVACLVTFIIQDDEDDDDDFFGAKY